MENYEIVCIIPTKNQDKFLKESVDSILNQTFKNFHLIIIDNGSTDSTPLILNEYKHKYKNSVYPKVTIDKELVPGTGAALNRGIIINKNTTKCKKFTWWASDNYLNPNAFELLNKFLDENPDIDMVYANMDVHVTDETCLNVIKIKNLKEEVGDQHWRPDYIFTNYYLGCVWLFKTEMLEKAGEWYMHEPCEDYDQAIRFVFAGGKFGYLDKNLGWFRRHDENMSKKIRYTGYAENLVKNLVKIRDEGDGLNYIKYTKWKYDPNYYEMNKNIDFDTWKLRGSIKDHYTKIYENNVWGGRESLSGKGSDISQAHRIIKRLPILFKKYDIKSIVDAPCGDLNWFRYILDENIKYIGIDIVDELIEKNKREFPGLEFYKQDLIFDKFEYDVDLILCRDFFVHIEYPQILTVIKKMVYSNSKYLLTTNFVRHDRKNQKEIDIEKGISWRPIQLMLPPINLPPPLETVNERCMEKDNEGTYEDKSLCLWKIDDIAKSFGIKKNVEIKVRSKPVCIDNKNITIVHSIDTERELESIKEIRPIKDDLKDILKDSLEDETETPKVSVKNGNVEIENLINKYKKRIPKWYLKKIPKIIHFYWGNKTLPYLRYLTVLSFHKLNPDWKIFFYYTENKSIKKTWKSSEHGVEIDKTNDYYKELKKIKDIKILKIDDKNHKDYPEVFKSDLLRWSLLCNEGGFWSDMDILYLKPMSKLYFNRIENENVDTIVQINSNNESYHTIGFLGGCEKNKFWYYIKEKAIRVPAKNFNNYQALGVCLLNKEFPVLKCLEEKFKDCNFFSYDKNVLYSYYPLNKLENLYEKDGTNYLDAKSIGIHWYGGYKTSIEYANKIKHDNYKELKIPICKFIEKIRKSR